jgi:hypothetical protein
VNYDTQLLSRTEYIPNCFLPRLAPAANGGFFLKNSLRRRGAGLVHALAPIGRTQPAIRDSPAGFLESGRGYPGADSTQRSISSQWSVTPAAVIVALALNASGSFVLAKSTAAVTASKLIRPRVGSVLDCYFFVDDGTVVLCTAAGKPTGEEKRLGPGDDPRSVARRLARDAWRREQNVAERVYGFGRPLRYGQSGLA